MRYDKPILIQRLNDAEVWEDAFFVHADVNKNNRSFDTEYLNAGAIQSKKQLVFTVRYFKALEDIDFDRGGYRIIYRDHYYNIVDYDDFKETHTDIKLTGVSY